MAETNTNIITFSYYTYNKNEKIAKYERKVDTCIAEILSPASGDAWCRTSFDYNGEHKSWKILVGMDNESISNIKAKIGMVDNKRLITSFYLWFTPDAEAKIIPFGELIKNNYIKLNTWLHHNGIDKDLYYNNREYKLAKYKTMASLFREQRIKDITENTNNYMGVSTTLLPFWSRRLEILILRYPKSYTYDEEFALSLSLDRHMSILQMEIVDYRCNNEKKGKVFDLLEPETRVFKKLCLLEDDATKMRAEKI